MRMTPSARASLVLGMLASAGACGCGHKCEPLYGGDATDEAWREMLDRYDNTTLDDTNAALVTVPAEGEVLTAAPTVAWDCMSCSLPAPAGAPVRVAATRPASPGLHAEAVRCGPRWDARRAIDTLASLLEGTAEAHKPPITAELYYLEFDVGENCALNVLTTDLLWAVDAASWETLRSAPQPLALTITNAYLVENRVTEGPFRPSAPRTFTAE